VTASRHSVVSGRSAKSLTLARAAALSLIALARPPISMAGCQAYAPWPERIRLALEPARTVRTGKPTNRLAFLSKTAQPARPWHPPTAGDTVMALRIVTVDERLSRAANKTTMALSGPSGVDKRKVQHDGQRQLAAEVSWDLPSLAPGATSLIDVTVSGARAGDLAQASLVSSTRFIELDAAVWSNNTVRVMARNISAATFDLTAATLSVALAHCWASSRPRPVGSSGSRHLTTASTV